jgi:hypothetical protein
LATEDANASGLDFPQMVTLGYAYRPTDMTVALAYQYYVFVERTISDSVYGPTVEGDWESDGHAANLSVGCRF